jgi:hypothetical protein
MYQTKAGMSTCGEGIALFPAAKSTLFDPDQTVFGGTFPICVTWPIFRPGRGEPLP